MQIRLFFAILVFFLQFSIFVHAAVPERKGWWKFDNSATLVQAEVGFGSDLIIQGSQTAATGPEEGNGAVLIGPGSYYKMKHEIQPVSGLLVNEYSMQFDFKIPASGIWHSFLQTTIKNNNDGDLFINPTGNIGVAAIGYTSYSVKPDEWYRLVITVKNGDIFNYYLDGNIVLQGAAQPVNGRFSLDSLLLVFADDDGEDGNIICSELAIWDKALSSHQAKELGGFGHDFSPFTMTRIPYLQSPGQNEMTICWHDTSAVGTRVDYSIDSSLNLTTAGTSEIIGEPFRWHTVKLTGLEVNTRYFYRVASGDSLSDLYSFRTLPDSSYSGKLRFVMFSDTHCPDTTMVRKVIRASKAKMIELYGPDIENNINGIFHSGDITVSGSNIDEYTLQYFKPLDVLTGNIPTMVVAGNHEGESPFFYNYLSIDKMSAFPKNPALNEKIWEMRAGNSLFIGLNTNIYSQYGTVQANWLDSKLNLAEKDSTIDFIFIFFHHPPFSEMWFDVLLLDDGPEYVQNVLFPIIKNYTKVQSIHTGHTHGFERGTITSDKTNGDFRIVCGGGGGGAIDSWGAFKNYDYNDIHMAIDNYCFQILEIDVANHSFLNTMYSLGDLNKSRNSEPMDKWYKKLLQSGPETPVAESAVKAGDFIQFQTSVFSGLDSLMTVELQLIESSANSSVVVDSLIHWKNVYGRDNRYNPVDKNKNIDLYHIKLKSSVLTANKSYFYKVRYRDHNLKWSKWSNSFPLPSIGVGVFNGKVSSDASVLSQNYPNPFKNSTAISYSIPERSHVNLRVYDTELRIISEIDEGEKSQGTYQLDIPAENYPSGVYFYQLTANGCNTIKKMVKIK
jgi:hypothetical protein